MSSSHIFTRKSLPIRFLATAALVCGPASCLTAQAQDGSGISRFFRLGTGRSESKPEHNHDHDHPTESDSPEVVARSTPNRSTSMKPESSGLAASPFNPAVTSPGFGENQSTRIAARSAYSGPVTEADPILTRVGIGRSDSGSKFALFIQIYADGTVIDSEGVHRLPVSQIKQILAIIRGHDFSKIRGHCGKPAADFIENVQVVVYDRSMGRLRAHAFSYAGNPEGCDQGVAHLHKAVEDLIVQISTGRSVESTASVTTTSTAPVNPVPVTISNNNSGTSIAPSLGLQGVVGSAQPVPVAIQPTINQGAVVPRLPATSTPPMNAGGAPELTLPR